MTKNLHDLDANLFVAEQAYVEAESMYDGLRRRGLSHAKADSISGFSKSERVYNRAIDNRIDEEISRLNRKPESIADVEGQFAVARRWEQRGFECAAVLAKIATALLQPGSLTDR